VGQWSASGGHGGSFGGDKPVELVRVADPVELDAGERPQVVFVGDEVAAGGLGVVDSLRPGGVVLPIPPPVPHRQAVRYAEFF
jgi:hypothetical protein